MKAPIKVIFVLAFFCSFFRLEASIDQRTERFLGMTPHAAFEYLKTGQGHEISGQLVRAAIEARRQDLIEIGFSYSGTWLIVALDFSKITDPDFQDQLMVTLLKADSGFWPPDDYATRDGSRTPLANYISPFRDVLFRNVPGMPMDGSSVETRAKRLELAEKIEANIASKKSHAVPILRKPEPTDDPTSPPLTIKERIPQNHTGIGTTGTEETSSWVIGLVVAILAVVGTVAGLLWKRRGHTT